jgi:arylamine N-acetyltransferase
MATLSPEQVAAYLDRISLPQNAREQLFLGPTGPDAVEAITKLQQHHMAAIPYDNVEMHYSASHAPTIDMNFVYDTVVRCRRGGICLQTNVLFSKLLRALGFSAYCTGGRINAATGLAVTAVSNPAKDRTRIAYGPWLVYPSERHMVCDPQR